MFQKLKNYDFTLMITPILLSAFGIVMIYSASMVTAVVVDEVESTYYLYKQFQWFVIGLIGFILASIIPYQFYQRIIKLMVLGSIILLIAVLFFGETAHNATRSISIASVNIQPSEFVKLAIILYLASVYSKKQAYINEFSRGVLPPLILTGIMLSLIVLQPDIGTSAIIFAIAFTIIMSSGIRFKHLFILIMIGLILLAIAIPNMVTDTRISRFTGAYQPFMAPEDGGYHLIQSYIAIGVGGLTGEGLGQSVQKLGYLWGAHTDFIMSIIAEELGFIGVIIVIGLLATIVLRGIFMARKCGDSFGSLLAIGISSMVGIQAFVNLGAISGILPITGVPLPFVSYGGSSLLVMLIAMGILNNIARSVKEDDHHEQSHPQPTDKQKVSDLHTYRGGKTWLN
ncbi:MAG TPA: FtsW/RodA/SpoVE family cell cycle protein [Virgibacillus sp.]|nr:FtsW/RodA/SpoVE family cell cycle protein [Virgibacillus sp.]